jgi:hypothetical protein
LCEDGIVLCADNQITWPQYHKYYECKLYTHGTSQWGMLNTFAGDPNLAKSFNEKFDDAMTEVAPPYTGAKIQAVIETVLSFLSVLDNKPEDLSMLCGIVTIDGEMRLAKTSGRVVSPVVTYDYVGVGDSSALRYLGQLISGVQHYRLYRADQAFMLATYLVLKAKTHVDGCGGDTDAMILRPNCHVELRSGDTDRTEQKILRIESKIRVVAQCFFDKRISEDNFDKASAELVRVLKEEHLEIVRRIWA